MKQFVIVSGISGAGKSQALKAFEDLGYYCVDNILPQLIPEIAKTLGGVSMREFDKVALVVDIRGGEFFGGIYTSLELLKHGGIPYRLLFLDASDEILINRYQETRREHPLAQKGMASAGIALERKATAQLKAISDVVIDTSALSLKQLKQKVYDIFGADKKDNAAVRIISFGFKRGAPAGCDFVYDCRWLPNPFNVESLRRYNGADKAVADFVFAKKDAAENAAEKFVKNIAAMIKLVLADYQKDVKPCMAVGVGCTGGKHRSVAVAARLAAVLAKAGITASAEHRDMYID